MRSAVFLLALAATGADPPPGGEGWLAEFEEGRTLATASGRDLLIDFGGTDWCLPCRWLKERVLSRPEFVATASARFVLVDIDLPARSPIDPDRKRRYEALQERYGIVSVPSVVLAMPDGRPYARETYREAAETPGAYWARLAPRVDRGRKLREAFERSRKREGRAKAEALAEGLAEVDARFVPRFFADEVAEIRASDPGDSTGYLAYLDGRRALEEFQSGLDAQKAEIDPAAVDALIARFHLGGESLREALVLRAVGEVLAGEDRRALASLARAVDPALGSGRFDRGDFVPLDEASTAAVRRRVAEGSADPGDGVALYYALHRIFGFELPNAFEASCGTAFVPAHRVNGPIGDRYGRALLRSTEGLRGEDRARALAKGLEGTFFAARGSIREVVLGTIPGLVGAKSARAMLPGAYYPRWLD